ncbi:histidine phosphotransferase family protein [Gymnodinialimonas ulvae]|uniref:histidine phosphotransferase family protein n=1 Tax=Gymnodinialimonas ulvae TaxID=3126504 RepID=UPI0030A2BB86
MLDVHSQLPTRLADLVASRLCHDLVNPLGAIGNGVELLEMTGKADGPEMELIRDAVHAAEARIRLFRLAFGSAGPDQNTSLREARQAVEGYFHQSRIVADWRIDGDRPRLETKLAFLMLLCAETTLPMGGEIAITQASDGPWSLEARGGRINIKADVWELLQDADLAATGNLRPSDAQFVVLAHVAKALGRVVTFSATTEAMTLQLI